MRPVRKPRHWWKGMPNDVPGRGRKAFASLFSTLRVKTFRGPSSGRSCLLSSCQNIFPIPLCFLGFFAPFSLSPSLPSSLFPPAVYNINFQFIRDRSRVLGKDRRSDLSRRAYKHLQISVVKIFIIPSIIGL